MATLSERIQVLFSRSQAARLQTLAHAEGVSVGALVRRAVEQTYIEPDRSERLRAVERLAAMDLPVADWERMEHESTNRYGD